MQANERSSHILDYHSGVCLRINIRGQLVEGEREGDH